MSVTSARSSGVSILASRGYLNSEHRKDKTCSMPYRSKL